MKNQIKLIVYDKVNAFYNRVEKYGATKGFAHIAYKIFGD